MYLYDLITPLFVIAGLKGVCVCVCVYLSESDGGGVHEMGAADLHHTHKGLRLRLQSTLQGTHLWDGLVG